ncbi:MAG: hypothetical protein AAGC53_18465 [Actinomycetota bacterium]
MRHVENELLEHGMAQVARSGVRVALEGVSLIDAARTAGVERSEAIQCWSGPGERDEAEAQFTEAVAQRVLELRPTSLSHSGADEPLNEVLDAFSLLVESMPDMATLTPAERGQWVRRFIRAGTGPDSAVEVDSLLWRSCFALAAGSVAQPQPDVSRRDAWIRGDAVTSTRFLNIYSTLAALFGLRLRSCYSWDQFTLAVRAMSEGLGLRATVDPDRQLLSRRTGPDGERESWSLMAVGFEALVRQFFEAEDPRQLIDLRHE